MHTAGGRTTTGYGLSLTPAAALADEHVLLALDEHVLPPAGEHVLLALDEHVLLALDEHVLPLASWR